VRPSSDTWWLIFAAAASVGAAPFIMRGDAATNTRREQSRQALEVMTPAERQRLNDSYERYKSLTSEERARWKAFHDELQRDRGQNPAVGKALNAYSEWVPSLSALQSNRLRTETDPEKRVSLITQIEQQKSEDNSFPAWRSPVKSSRFYDAMAVIEKEATRVLNSQQREEFMAMPERTARRSLTMIQLLRKQNENATFTSVVSEAALQEIVGILGKDGIKKAEDERNKRDPESQNEFWWGPRVGFARWFVRRELARKLIEELMIDGKNNASTDEDLLAMLKSIKSEDREGYYSIAASDVKMEMRREVFKERVGFDPVGKFFESVWGPPRKGFNRGPDGGRRNEGRPGSEHRGPREDRDREDDKHRGPPHDDNR
jgi:hypothetical protein